MQGTTVKKKDNGECLRGRMWKGTFVKYFKALAGGDQDHHEMFCKDK
jgi:hypothetical protein